MTICSDQHIKCILCTELRCQWIDRNNRTVTIFLDDGCNKFPLISIDLHAMPAAVNIEKEISNLFSFWLHIITYTKLFFDLCDLKLILHPLWRSAAFVFSALQDLFCNVICFHTFIIEHDTFYFLFYDNKTVLCTHILSSLIYT